MAQVPGRPLAAGEVVHHRNGGRLDNLGVTSGHTEEPADVE